MNAHTTIQTRGDAMRKVHAAADDARQYAVQALIAELKARVGKELSEVLDAVEAIYHDETSAHYEARERLAKASGDILMDCGVEQ